MDSPMQKAPSIDVSRTSSRRGLAPELDDQRDRDDWWWTDIDQAHISALRRNSEVLKKLEDLKANEATKHLPLPWIKTSQADVVFAIVIIVYAILTGVKLELQAMATSGELSPAAEYTILILETVIVMFGFLPELLLWVRAEGLRYMLPCNPTGCFDAVVILLGLLELAGDWSCVLVSICGMDGLIPTGPMRIFRLVRLARIFRVLIVCKELKMLLKSLFSSLSAVFWSFVLLSMMMYLGTLFCVILLGHIPELKKHFGRVGTGLFTHFVLVTLEGWPDIAEDVRQATNNNPLWAVYFIVFICITSMALMNLVTGIVCERCIGLSQSEDEDEDSVVQVVTLPMVVRGVSYAQLAKEPGLLDACTIGVQESLARQLLMPAEFVFVELGALSGEKLTVRAEIVLPAKAEQEEEEEEQQAVFAHLCSTSQGLVEQLQRDLAGVPGLIEVVSSGCKDPPLFGQEAAAYFEISQSSKLKVSTKSRPRAFYTQECERVKEWLEHIWADGQEQGWSKMSLNPKTDKVNRHMFAEMLGTHEMKRLLAHMNVSIDLDADQILELLDFKKEFDCSELCDALMRLRGSRQQLHSMMLQRDVLKIHRTGREYVAEMEMRVTQETKTHLDRVQATVQQELDAIAQELERTQAGSEAVFQAAEPEFRAGGSAGAMQRQRSPEARGAAIPAGPGGTSWGPAKAHLEELLRELASLRTSAEELLQEDTDGCIELTPSREVATQTGAAESSVTPTAAADRFAALTAALDNSGREIGSCPRCGAPCATSDAGPCPRCGTRSTPTARRRAAQTRHSLLAAADTRSTPSGNLSLPHLPSRVSEDREMVAEEANRKAAEEIREERSRQMEVAAAAARESEEEQKRKAEAEEAAIRGVQEAAARREAEEAATRQAEEAATLEAEEAATREVEEAAAREAAAAARAATEEVSADTKHEEAVAADSAEEIAVAEAEVKAPAAKAESKPVAAEAESEADAAMGSDKALKEVEEEEEEKEEEATTVQMPNESLGASASSDQHRTSDEERKVKDLEEMGFTQALALQALQRSGGDVEQAVMLLLSEAGPAEEEAS